MRLLSFVFGMRAYLIRKAWVVGAINLLARLDISYDRLEKDEEGNLHFTVPAYKRKLLERALTAEGIVWERGALSGLPDIFRRYKKRWGIAVGFLIFVFLVAVSGGRIWCVEISGKDRKSVV